MSNLVATHAQKASEAEQGNHIIFFSPSLKPCPSIYEKHFILLTLQVNFSIASWLFGLHLGLPSGSPGFESDRRTEILRSLSFN